MVELSHRLVSGDVRMIDRLCVDKRIALAQALWDSIAAEPHPPLLTEAQRQELERRLADHQADPSDVVPWEQIKAEALARFQSCSPVGQAPPDAFGKRQAEPDLRAAE
jgi:putative addiction module component (TIGR02574 family)